MDAIYIIGIFISFFIAVLLLTKSGKSLPDKILAAWMVVIGIHLLHFYAYTLGYWTKYPHLVGITAPFPLFYGPMLYFYILYSVRMEKQIRKVDYLHFLPIVLSYLYLIPFFFFYTAEEKQLVDQGELEVFSTFITLSLIGFAISFITYPILSYKQLTKHQKLVAVNFSYDEGINFTWLRNIIICLGVFFITTLIVLMFQRILDFEFGFQPDNIFYGLAIIFVIILGYFGVKQQNIFSPQLHINPIVKTEYEKSGLKATVAKTYHRQLLAKMLSEKPYLDSKLTLSKLASMLAISSNHLSQIINQYEKVNFRDFVNQYRIDEFKALAKKNPHYSILALALEAGFNSKSAFNQIFKKQTGKTPSQYLSGS